VINIILLGTSTLVLLFIIIISVSSFVNRRSFYELSLFYIPYLTIYVFVFYYLLLITTFLMFYVNYYLCFHAKYLRIYY